MRPQHRHLTLALVATASTLIGCLGKTGDTGGETHWQKGWLSGCVSDSECPAGLACVGYLCTLVCSDDAACADMPGTSCLDVGGDSACATPERLGCDAANVPCDDASAGWFCPASAAAGCVSPIVICQDGVWSPGQLDTCRDTVTHSTSEGGAAVDETVIGDAPVAIDILFVVDNSTSMSGEQLGLGRALAGFVVALDARVAALPRIAATSVDAQCDVDGATVFSSKGLFNTVPARSVPPPAQFSLSTLCASDEDCEAAACDVLGACDGQQGLWSCLTAPIGCAENPNGSVNTSCRRHCQGDEECRLALGDAAAHCQQPSANQADWGCIVNPPTDLCPETLPPFVEGDELALAPCLTSVGFNQEKCFKYEQGLEASRLALDPGGPNAAQAAAFVRPEALLVLVYLTNEDDCSAAEPLGEDFYETCALLPSTADGGPLTATSSYVDFLRGLKPPGRVMTLAIVGQSLASDPSDIEADYAAFTASLGDARVCYHQSQLCQSASGSAQWGRRYLEVAAGLGPDGETANLCALEDDLSAPLERLAAHIAENSRRICVPPAAGGSFVVELVRGGVATPLDPGASGDAGYALVHGAPECPGGEALVPGRALAAGDIVRFTTP